MIKKLLMGVFTACFLATAQADEAAVKAGLARLLPGLKPDSVTQAPVPGLYEIQFGSKLVYVSADGRYLVQGQIIDMESRENLTEARQTGIRAATLKSLPEDEMVIFAPEDYQHTVTVFTDIDCGYCRKLHREMDAYNKAGIRIRYMFFPRAGVGSPSYNKAVSVWCAADRKQAMTDAKSGKNPEEKSCENPVDKHLALGRQFGVRGTPALVLENGELLPGYLPADHLKKVLEGESPE